MKSNSLLDDAKAFFGGFHFAHIICIVIGGIGGHWEAHTAVIHPYFIAHFAAKQFIHRHPCGFTSNVPQGHFDGADGAAPRFKATHTTYFEHHAFNIGRVFAKNMFFVKQHHRL